MKISRVEAITDGIIAIAATIMVLELEVPASNNWSDLLELGHTFMAYVISFLMIYLAWAMHHDLFKKATHLSKRSFMVNGVWILCLTLVPFTTAWVGSAPDATPPEFLYPLNLLLWNLAFRWLVYQVKKDNPEAPWERERLLKQPVQVAMYVVFFLCMILAFILPRLSIYLIGLTILTSFIWALVKKKKKEV